MEEIQPVDIHIYLAPEVFARLEALMAFGGYRSRSHLVEQLIIGIEEIIESYWAYQECIKEVKDPTRLQNFANFFDVSLLQTLNRLGYRGYQRFQKKRKRASGAEVV